MGRSILEGKQILAVNDEPEVLQVLENEILKACPDCRFDKATTYIQAVERMVSLTYDLIILDHHDVRTFDLLGLAERLSFPVVMLTTNSLKPQALNQFLRKSYQNFLPKEKLKEAVPFLENLLKDEHSSRLRHIFRNLRGFFNRALRPIPTQIRGVKPA